MKNYIDHFDEINKAWNPTIWRSIQANTSTKLSDEKLGPIYSTPSHTSIVVVVTKVFDKLHMHKKYKQKHHLNASIQNLKSEW